MTENGTTRVSDKFVRDHAVPEDEAETFAHVGYDRLYHPAGGYWFPSDIEPGDDLNGWVRADAVDDVLPTGEVVQYPCDDRKPRVIGNDDVPAWVLNRVVDADADDLPSKPEVADALFETLAAFADLRKRLENGDDPDRALPEVLSAYDLYEADRVFARTGHERAGSADPESFAVDEVVCSECGESHDDGACWDEADTDGADA